MKNMFSKIALPLLITNALYANGPGGISSNLQLWLKADQGVNKESITNGDFATLNSTGWTVTNPANIRFADGNVAFNYGDTTPNGVIQQTISTTSSGAYQVTFDTNRNGGGTGTVSFKAEIIDSATSTVLATKTISKTNTSGFTSETLNFTATGTSTILRFTDTSTATNSIDIHLDNISVLQQAANGETIKAWLDLSGNNYHATQPTAANQPTVGLVATSNFNQTVQFNPERG